MGNDDADVAEESDDAVRATALAAAETAPVVQVSYRGHGISRGVREARRSERG